jgi:thiol:disulfide interchange protein DsbG
LWQASLPLHSKVKFVWIPISFNPAKSLPQGAALLSAANPVDTMNTHEQSLLAGTGGIAASADVSDELKKAINNNTQLLNQLGVDSVPFLLGKHRKTGAIVSFNGAMETAALANLLGIE